MSYTDVLEGTTYQQNNNFDHGIRQMRWIATYMRKLRIVNPGQPDQFVIQA